MLTRSMSDTAENDLASTPNAFHSVPDSSLNPLDTRASESPNSASSIYPVRPAWLSIR